MNSLQIQPSNSFHANLALAAGASVSITAETMELLATIVARLQGPAVPGINGAKSVADKPATAKAEAGNAPATTAAPASAPPADSGSEAAGSFTYDDVKARVLALAKVNRELAQQTLAQFKTVAGAAVDHGNKLQLPDYPAFIAAADKALGK